MNEKDMNIEMAYRNFRFKHADILSTLDRLEFPDNAIKFIFKCGYEAKHNEAQMNQEIEQQILQALKKQFA